MAAKETWEVFIDVEAGCAGRVQTIHAEAFDIDSQQNLLFYNESECAVGEKSIVACFHKWISFIKAKDRSIPMKEKDKTNRNLWGCPRCSHVEPVRRMERLSDDYSCPNCGTPGAEFLDRFGLIAPTIHNK